MQKGCAIPWDRGETGRLENSAPLELKNRGKNPDGWERNFLRFEGVLRAATCKIWRENVVVH